MRKVIIILLGMALMAGGCQKDGPLEKAGSRIDEIGDNIADGDPPLQKKGPMEKAGEAVDETLGTDRQENR